MLHRQMDQSARSEKRTQLVFPGIPNVIQGFEPFLNARAHMFPVNGTQAHMWVNSNLNVTHSIDNVDKATSNQCFETHQL